MFRSSAGLLSAITVDSSHRSFGKDTSLWKNGDIIAHFPGMSIQIYDEHHEREMNLSLICDAGCSVLAMTQPYALGLASYGMGASIAVAARSCHLALIGDYALLRSGLNALIKCYEKDLRSWPLSVKNNSTAMTGMQRIMIRVRYLSFADPVICRTDDELALKQELVVPDRPRTLIIEGTCPEGSSHETVEY